jgi:hypothetical protein
MKPIKPAASQSGKLGWVLLWVIGIPVSNSADPFSPAGVHLTHRSSDMIVVPAPRIRTVGELIDRAIPERQQKPTGHYRVNAVYHGPDSAEPLLTSLDKLGGIPHAKGEVEEHILRNSIRYSRPQPAPRQQRARSHAHPLCD